MAAVLAGHARGETFMPLRSVMMPPDAAGFMGLMPGWSRGRGDGTAAFALKAVCIMPGNPARGLDAHQGLVTLFDGATGMPTAILDASAITAVRTAAVTAVATGALARTDAATLAVLGAGTQARAHLRALAGVRAFERVWVHAPTTAHAEDAAAEAGAAGWPASPSPPARRRRSATPTWS
jgi:ornithine cyclodeaminase